MANPQGTCADFFVPPLRETGAQEQGILPEQAAGCAQADPHNKKMLDITAGKDKKMKRDASIASKTCGATDALETRGGVFLSADFFLRLALLKRFQGLQAAK